MLFSRRWGWGEGYAWKNLRPASDELAQEIADDLQTAWEQFASIAEKVKG
jgi:hypothetical protein